MGGDEYTSVTSGKLKLKGVADGRVEKKKKKKKKPKSEDDPVQQDISKEGVDGGDQPTDSSVMLKYLADEHADIAKEELEQVQVKSKKQNDGPEDVRDFVRTESQKRFEEQRRKRLEERLKREGVKTHKQRVEELNKYLSTLSEHHDMPKIGPG